MASDADLTRVLVTGGSGYIGSVTCVALLEAGFDVVAIDNFSNSSPSVFDRVQQLAGRSLTWSEVDIRDGAGVREVFAREQIDAVIHFAGLKAVGESVEQPLRYYDHNVVGALAVFEAMQEYGVHHIVFSSSATVYGEPEHLPLGEDERLTAVNPYGRTKLMIEQILGDYAASDPRLHTIALRYFNPAGAHPSGLIGEAPLGVPNNLLPFLMQVAVGIRPELVIFGDDYATPDGTCIRDYIHVCDLAFGHVAALRALPRLAGFTAINLGTGNGYSVREVVAESERAIGAPLPVRIGPRRPGDAPATYADPSRAAELLGWRAERDLAQMCVDAWRWQQYARDAGLAES